VLQIGDNTAAYARLLKQGWENWLKRGAEILARKVTYLKSVIKKYILRPIGLLLDNKQSVFRSRL
jgi:hypothetical protein